MLKFLRSLPATVAVIGALFGSIVATLGALNYSGYCLEQRRFISDQEQIDIVVEQLVINYPPFDPDERADKNGRALTALDGLGTPILYKNAHHGLNPNCCVVTAYDKQDGFKPDWTYKIAGLDAGFVSVKYQLRYLDSSGIAHSKIHQITLARTNCGNNRHPV